MSYVCSPSYSITIRLEIENRIGMFAMIATAISSAGGDLGSVDIVRVEKGKIIRDITVNARDEDHEKAIVKAIKTVDGVKVLRSMDRTFFSHEGGKIEIKNKLPVRDRNDLSKVYTPGWPGSAWTSTTTKSMPTAIPSRAIPWSSSPTGQPCSAWATSGPRRPCR